ncbi:hypothetical protein [Microcoleus sp. CAWBG58]|uniref:hypothetical protein n=1 Tax=Microcoleus sp. CAWBG58 TaxID=2841651 RepID=UPI0025D25B81|nr:hypothetical protein [Microcoleus sp. CAWBG58]
MSVLLFLITFIVGLVVTAVINRLMALFYCFMFLGLGIFLLISYRAALSPVIEFIFFMIFGLIGIFSAIIFFCFFVVVISAYIERFIAYLKNKKW